MKWLFAESRNVKLWWIILMIAWALLLLSYSLSFSWRDKQHWSAQTCTNYTGGTAWEIQDRRIACRNEAEYYLEIVEALKVAEESAKCNQLNNCKGL